MFPCTAVEISVAAHDTTGGMETKILEAAVIARLGIDVYITKVRMLGSIFPFWNMEDQIFSFFFLNEHDPSIIQCFMWCRLEQNTRWGP